MQVVRDVLDKAVVDRNGRAMGRVDGIVLALREGQPPRLDAILIGPAALGDRLQPRLGRWVRAIEAHFGIRAGRPVRVDFADVVTVERKVKVSLAIGETDAEVVEQRLRRWLAKLPGGR